MGEPEKKARTLHARARGNREPDGAACGHGLVVGAASVGAAVLDVASSAAIKQASLLVLCRGIVGLRFVQE